MNTTACATFWRQEAMKNSIHVLDLKKHPDKDYGNGMHMLNI